MKANTHLEQNNNISSSGGKNTVGGPGSQNHPSAGLMGQTPPTATAGAVH